MEENASGSSSFTGDSARCRYRRRWQENAVEAGLLIKAPSPAEAIIPRFEPFRVVTRVRTIRGPPHLTPSHQAAQAQRPNHDHGVAAKPQRRDCRQEPFSTARSRGLARDIGSTHSSQQDYAGQQREHETVESHPTLARGDPRAVRIPVAAAAGVGSAARRPDSAQNGDGQHHGQAGTDFTKSINDICRARKQNAGG